MSIEKYPECGNNMEYGRIYSNGGIAWNVDPQPIKRQSLIGLEILQKSPLLLIKGFNGFRCQVCRIVVFEYPKV